MAHPFSIPILPSKCRYCKLGTSGKMIPGVKAKVSPCPDNEALDIFNKEDGVTTGKVRAYDAAYSVYLLIKATTE